MSYWKMVLMLVCLGLPAWAQPELAGPQRNVLLSIEFGAQVQQGEKQVRRLARPTVLTADGQQAEVRLGGLAQESGKDKFDFSIATTPTIQGAGEGLRIRMKLRVVVERPNKGPLRQSCTMSAAPGESVEFTLEAPEGGEEYTISVIPYVLEPGQEFKGFDKEHKPIIR